MKKKHKVCSGGGVCVSMVCNVYVYVCVCFSKIHPQEPSQLKESLNKLMETVDVELAPGLMSVY